MPGYDACLVEPRVPWDRPHGTRVLHRCFAEGGKGAIRLHLSMVYVLHRVDSQGQKSSGVILAVAGRSSRNSELSRQGEC
eukprot:14341122-Alexandrium_andersonii.AAC.1